MIELQSQIESIYCKSNIKELIKSEIDSSPISLIQSTLESLIQSLLDSRDSYHTSKRLRYLILSRTSTAEIAQVIINSILPIINHNTTKVPIQGIATQIGLNFHEDQIKAVKTGAELLAVGQSSGLYNLLAYDGDENTTCMIQPNYKLDDSTLHAIHLTQYLPPMICEPLDWTNTKEGGTLKTNDSCILGHGNDIGQSQDLDTLNKLQKVSWSLIPEMLTYSEEAQLKVNPDEPEWLVARKREQHQARCLQSKQVYKLMVENNNQFYFVWKYDKRGRLYSQGYDVNLQGSQYKKATIEFTNKHKLTGV